MAEFLIVAQSRTNPDAVKDARGCWKRGDIVVVQPDGHVWGAKESLPRFVKLKMPGVAVEKARAYLAAHTSVDPFTGESVVLTRRRWRVLVDSVPAGVRQTLRETGEVTLSWSQVRNYVQDKVTLNTAPAST